MEGTAALRAHMIARLVFFCACILGTSTLTHEPGELGGGGTVFNEELLLRPLPDGRIAAHFSFSQHLSHPENPTSFPKPIIQLVQDSGFAHAELAFGRGRWHAKKWGQPLLRTVSSGAQLLASFKRDASPDEVQAAWTNLTHGLGAIFCGSLSFLENGPAKAQPIFSPFHGLHEAEHVHRYGALPREMLCTENLTPWLKLLPCRDRAGLGAPPPRSPELCAALRCSGPNRMQHQGSTDAGHPSVHFESAAYGRGLLPLGDPQA
ncbi:hypothetical protein CYMTET_19024 [Cymbomonas tetramitiformis]|uniref:Uncharacterized protein n=1 Tax=Cymbomonas tetramitiformis TaxID=36881 RepID=A0AAE0G7I9_9CHLO|nr:hypothetical protein CYMTET_19024 [Cymbomonas tetramitiformis]